MMLLPFGLSLLTVIFTLIQLARALDETTPLRRLRRFPDEQVFKAAPASSCNPWDCPCFNTETWPEFVRAIEAYSSRQGACNNKDCCYEREDLESYIVELVECQPTLNVAYMSFDYAKVTSGCPASGRCMYCGDSSNINFLSAEEAYACESLIHSKIDEQTTCANDTLPCFYCPPDCPCCNTETWPEFVRAIKAYSYPQYGCKEDCCYEREDLEIDIVALVQCQPTRNVAYMSFDYSKVTSRCPTSDPCMYCGDSSSSVNVLSAEEAYACESLIRSKIDEQTTCANDVLPCFDCRPDCPCCNTETWPEFVRAIKAYSYPQGYACREDCCYEREDVESDIVALVQCQPTRNVAYMSFDYAKVTYGCPASGPCMYCGDSSSNFNFLSAEEASACESVIRFKIDSEQASCANDVFPC